MLKIFTITCLLLLGLTLLAQNIENIKVNNPEFQLPSFFIFYNNFGAGLTTV